MINKSRNESTLEKVYKNLESGMPENKSIKEYALPNARQWLGGRFVAIWVLPIYFLRKIAKFSASSAFVKPYSPSVNGPSYKQPETLFTSLRSVFRGEDHLRFFDHRFIGIWVLPIALTGIVFEILLIAPTNNTSPFKDSKPESIRNFSWIPIIFISLFLTAIKVLNLNNFVKFKYFIYKN